MDLTTKKLDKLSLAEEKKLIQELTASYKQALAEIKKDIAVMEAKAGEFTYGQMVKYNRLQTLEKQIDATLKNLDKSKRSLFHSTLEDIYKINYTGTGEAIYGAVKLDRTLPLPDRKAITDSIFTPLDKIALDDNAEQVVRSIRRDITASLIKGESIPKVTKRIQNSLEKNANNAVRIARTEITGTLNRSRLDAMDKLQGVEGIELRKKWVATRDTRTRDTHSEIDGEVRDLDKPFSNGLMYPGDQRGPASEVINCRCSMITEFSFDE